MNRDALIEQVAGAHRERDVHGAVAPSPAWRDLDPADRLAAFDAALVQRRLEAAADADGLSLTARAVLGRLR